jgi:hypothetical protein
LCSPALAQQGFSPLPFTNSISEATALSGDGTTVTGWFRAGNSFISPIVAFRWTRAAGLSTLPALSGATNAFAFGTDQTGSIIVGDSDSTGTIWSSAAGFSPAAAGIFDRVVDVSANGAVRITSTSFFSGGNWFEPGSPPNQLSEPQFRRLSGDGSLIAGKVVRRVQTGSGGYSGPIFSSFDRIAVYNTQSDSWSVVEPLIDYEHCQALSISADGRVSVGSSTDDESTLPQRAVRSVDGGPALSLGALTPSDASVAADVSADGSVIVGRSGNTAFVWTAAAGMRSVQSILQANGISTGGWQLTSADSVSDSGLIIAGNGLDSLGRRRQWVADLSVVCSPAATDVNASVALVAMADQSDSAGGTFGNLGFFAASIEPAGTIAFSARRTDNTVGLYFASPDPAGTVVTPVAVPGVVGTFTGIDRFVLRSPQSIAFVANNSSTIVAGDPRGSRTVIAATGQAAPNTGGGVFGPPEGGLPTFTNLALNSLGTVGFQSSIVGATTGAAGYRAAGGTLSRAFFGASPSFPTGGVADSTVLALSDSNLLVRSGNEVAQSTPLLAGGTGDILAPLLFTGATLANSPRLISSFSIFSAAVSGEHIVTLPFLSGPSGSALVHSNEEVGNTLLASLGDTVTVAGAPTTLTAFSGAVTVTPSGTAYFGGTLANGQTGIFSVSINAPQSITPAILAGSQLPGTTCRNISAFGFFLSSAGERLLVQVSYGLIGEVADGTALVAFDPARGLVPLIATGDSVQISPGVSTPVVSVVAASTGSTGDDGRPASFTTTGQAVTEVTLNVSGTPKRALVRIAADFTVTPAGCSVADLDTTGSGPDGTLDGSDFIAFINSFGIGDATVDPLADIVDAGGTPPGDGTIDGSDFIAFINAFAAGC